MGYAVWALRCSWGSWHSPLHGPAAMRLHSAEAWSDLKGPMCPSCWLLDFLQPASGHLGMPVGLGGLPGDRRVSLSMTGYCCWSQEEESQTTLTRKIVPRPSSRVLPGISREDHPWHGVRSEVLESAPTGPCNRGSCLLSALL